MSARTCFEPDYPLPERTTPDMSEQRVAARKDLKPRKVMGAGKYAVGNSGGELFAVTRRCRHLGADLANGGIDKDGCLVCPWHQSAYDVSTGRMVRGPQGIFAKIPGLSASPSRASPACSPRPWHGGRARRRCLRLLTPATPALRCRPSSASSPDRACSWTGRRRGSSSDRCPEGVAVHARAGKSPYQIGVLFAPTLEALVRRWPSLHAAVTPAGRLWVAWPKKTGGVVTDLDESLVREHGAVPRTGGHEGLRDRRDLVGSGLRGAARRSLAGRSDRDPQ